VTDAVTRGQHQPSPADEVGYRDPPPRMGFFTDTSICIGCKACEVACKEWNLVPDDGLTLTGMSYDNTGMLGANSWRHVAFIEQPLRAGRQQPGIEQHPTGGSASGHEQRVTQAVMSEVDSAQLGTDTGEVPVEATRAPVDLGMPGRTLPGHTTGAETRTEFRWLMSSDVCKHCTSAACLDVCPTGSLFRTEFGTVVVQEDICNGCGYCVPACPFGVIDQRKDDGRAWKCTLCYDRLGSGLEPACSKACPTDSIQFGPLDELRERAQARVDQLVEAGVTDARLYGHDPDDGVDGAGAFFLLLAEPEVYGLPPDPVVTTRDLGRLWRHAALAGAAFAAGLALAFGGAQ
jgi:formate dehydrogenase iron-sulfur subunit